MSDDSPPEFVVDRDDVIDTAFEHLVDDDLEGFILVSSIDGNLEGVSFSPRYNNPEEFDEIDICQFPMMELLGGCIAEIALEFGLPPEDVADVGVHCTVDHLGVDSETTKESWREVFEKADIDENASQEEYEQVLDELRDSLRSKRE